LSSKDCTGDLILKTLGFSMSLYPGDAVFFQAAVVPHVGKKLKPSDAGERMVVTLFSCEATTKYLEDYLDE
jgi:hypothetical protein